MLAMATLDWIVLGVLALSLAVGAWRGLVYELFYGVGWVVAFFITRLLVPQLATQFFVMLRSKPGRVFTFGFCGVLAAPATGRFLLRGNQKRCHMAVLYSLPETDLFFRIQLTPVLRIVRITHLHSPCSCFWRPDTSVWLRSERVEIRQEIRTA